MTEDPTCSSLQVNNAAPYGYGDGLRTVTGSQLVHNVLDVHLDRFLGDEEFFGNVAVAIAASDLLKDFDFSRGEGLVAVVLRQMGRNGWWDTLFPGMNLTDRLDEVLWRHALQHVASSTALERPLDFDIAFGCRQHNDACLRELLANGNHRVDAAHIGEPDIHKGDVRMEFAKAFKSLPPAGCLAYYAHVRLVVDEGSDSLAQ